jgi:hypothetical protein
MRRLRVDMDELAAALDNGGNELNFCPDLENCIEPSWGYN